MWPEEGDFPENLHCVVYVIIDKCSFESFMCLDLTLSQCQCLLTHWQSTLAIANACQAHCPCLLGTLPKQAQFKTYDNTVLQQLYSCSFKGILSIVQSFGEVALTTSPRFSLLKLHHMSGHAKPW